VRDTRAKRGGHARKKWDAHPDDDECAQAAAVFYWQVYDLAVEGDHAAEEEKTLGILTPAEIRNAKHKIENQRKTSI